MTLRSFVSDVSMYVENNIARYVEELAVLCAIDSGSDYKPGLDKMATMLSMRMRDLAMDVTIIEHGEYGNDIKGTLQGEGSSNIVLLGHTDTVYPRGTAAERPLCINGNVLRAPGASDMKGCILSALYAIEAMQFLDYRSYGKIHILCVSDEETSQRHSVKLIEEICHGCDAVLVLEAARENGDIVSARKGTAWYTLTAQGRSAHAGVEPWKGRNAILELAHQILQFQSLNQSLDGLFISPGVISGGILPNIVPEQATARFDVRFLHPADRKATEERWLEILQQQYVPDVKLNLQLEAYRDPMVCTPGTMKLVHQAQEIASLLGFSLDHVLSGGTSDGRYAASLGVPVLDGLGPIGGLDHSPDEYLLLDSVALRTALVAGLLATLSK
jgi:glutamate carboxypeptidase